MLCGMMVQVAMQLGLHRPSHTQDFSKFRVELIEDELRDKVRTWAICNIVAQRYVQTHYQSLFAFVSCFTSQGFHRLWTAIIYSLRLDIVLERFARPELQASRRYKAKIGD